MLSPTIRVAIGIQQHHLVGLNGVNGIRALLLYFSPCKMDLSVYYLYMFVYVHMHIHEHIYLPFNELFENCVLISFG